MTLRELTTRVRRLGDMASGLTREVTVWKTRDDPLLYAERQAYLQGIQKAIEGVEAARAALVGVRQRLEKEREPAQKK